MMIQKPHPLAGAANQKKRHIKGRVGLKEEGLVSDRALVESL